MAFLLQNTYVNRKHVFFFKFAMNFSQEDLLGDEQPTKYVYLTPCVASSVPAIHNIGLCMYADRFVLTLD